MRARQFATIFHGVETAVSSKVPELAPNLRHSRSRLVGRVDHIPTFFHTRSLLLDQLNSFGVPLISCIGYGR